MQFFIFVWWLTLFGELGEANHLLFQSSVFCLGLYVLHVGTRCRELPIWVKWPPARRCLATVVLGCDPAATSCCAPLLSTAPGAQPYMCLNALPLQEQLQIHSKMLQQSRVESSSSTVKKCFCRGNWLISLTLKEYSTSSCELCLRLCVCMYTYTHIPGLSELFLWKFSYYLRSDWGLPCQTGLQSMCTLWHMFSLWKTAFIDLGETSCLGRASCHYGLRSPFADHGLKQEGRETSALSSVWQTKLVTIFWNAQTIAQNNPIIVLWFIFAIMLCNRMKTMLITFHRRNISLVLS